MLMERGIESDTNDIISYSDRDLLLPPRKRLLAGMKRQNLDLNVVIPSSFRYGGSDFEARMNSLVKSHLKNPYSSNEEIVEASRSAAIEASKVALAARAAAKEKAAKAVKAVADAKNALKLAAIVNEETDNQEKYLKKNKMKAIESLHGNENGKTGDDLALKLDQMINRASAILKGSSTSDSDSPKTKKLKTDVCNVGTSNGIADDIDSDGFVAEKHIAVVDLNNSSKLKIIYRDTSRLSDSNLSRTIKEEREKALVKHQLGKDDDACDTDKKKYKIKQKKLPLSICNVKDEESLKEEDLKDKCSSSNDDSKSKCVTRSKSFNSVGGASGDNIVQDENAIVWKCKALKVPAACVK